MANDALCTSKFIEIRIILYITLLVLHASCNRLLGSGLTEKEKSLQKKPADFYEVNINYLEFLTSVSTTS